MPTILSDIRSNAIAVWCYCGHSDVIEVAAILARVRDMTVPEAVARMRCSRCRARGQVTTWRIVYVGGGAQALAAGHGQRLDDPE